MSGGMAQATANALLLLIFNATAWANYADNASSTPQTNVGIALHTADPTTTGNATSQEMATSGASGYNGYARINVPRTSATPGWVIASNVVNPTAAMTFPAGTGGTGVATFFSTSKSNANPTPTGAQALLYWGGISPTITCGNGITPSLTTASSISMV